jgi:PAS domain S-box-containing protein
MKKALLSRVVVEFGVAMKFPMGHNISKIRERDAALRRGPKKPIALKNNYRAIFDAANDAIFVIDIDTGAILDANRKMCDMYGYTSDEVAKITIGEKSAGYPPYTQEDAVRWVSRAAREGPQLFEWLAKDKSGRLFWVEVNLKLATIEGTRFVLAVVRDIAERKRTEELLQKERSTFFSVLQKAPYGMMLIDKDGTIIYLNPEFTAITGYTLKEVPTRKHWLRKAYPDKKYRAQASETWQKDFAKKGVDRVFSIVCKSREVKQVEFRATFLEDGRAVLAFTDITARKRAEETMRRSQETLNAVFNGVYDAIFLHEFDGTIIDVNDKMVELYQVSREQATQLSIVHDYSSRNNPLKDLPATWKNVVEGRNQFFEWKARRPKDGSVFDAEVFLRRITMDDRDVILATVRDITGRKSVENAVKESEERYRTLVENSSDAILVMDRHRNILSCNRAFLEMFGYTKDDVEGRSISMIHPTEESFREYGDIAYPTIERTGTFRSEWNFIRKNGTLFPGDIVTSAIATPERTLSGYVSFIRDSTERKSAEDAIKRRNLELAALNRITTSVSSSLEMAEILQTLKTLFIEHLEIPGGSISLYDQSQDRIVIDTQWGIPHPMLEAFKTFALSHFHRAHTLWEQGPFFSADFRNVPEFTIMGLDVARPDWQSYLSFPLVAKGEVDGFACLFSKAPAVFDFNQVSFFQTLGHQVGVAVQNAGLFEQVRAGRKQMQMLSHRLVEVQEAERRYIARELHDEVGQAMTGLKLLLETSFRQPLKEIRRSLEEAQTIVNRLMGLVRELSLKLRPAMLDDLGLLPALLWQIERFTAQTSVKVDLRQSGLSGRFSVEVETAAYRIVQEALTNVARHACVEEATVRIWSDGRTLGIQVEDSGAGFTADTVFRAGTSSGLAGMRERVVLLGGQFTVDSAPCSGTRITAELPLEDFPV